MRSSDTTVIVVGYNHARFFVECLDSIREQSLAPQAVLVADDASTDDTRTVVQTYGERFDGFLEFYPNAHNRGLTPTLNAMLEHVRTEFVTYIAADDLMLPGRLERQIELMRRTGAELSYTDAVVIDDESNVLFETSRIEYPWPPDFNRPESLLERLFEANWIPAASIMMRTDALRSLGGYDERIFFEDYELLTRAAAGGWSFEALEEPAVAVRRLGTSLGAVGFVSTSPRFILAHDAALRNFPITEDGLGRRVASARWELAKRAANTDMSTSQKLELMHSARRGAGSVPAYLYHLARTAIGR
ncbi:glycosyltransferase family 2 protein [Microbacterium bovistercoris]|uniref:glycosyltransferase family 2 protein n=1 Tax=Microbacterium bovistercoris TaxID=2293570 RepID=UPI0015F29834|nr:glycosyltransferase [Microbacterium bovistercoris]